MMAALRPKRGDSWEFECFLTDENGDPVSVADLEITASFRAGEDYYDFTVTKPGTPIHKFLLSFAPENSAAVVPMLHNSDIQLEENGDVDSSETFSIVVGEDVTGAN